MMHEEALPLASMGHGVNRAGAWAKPGERRLACTRTSRPAAGGG